MLASLRLNSFISGDDKQDEIDAAYSGEHVPDEALVAGDIDEAEAKSVATISCRKLQVREANVDGDAAPLFFFESVSVDPSQGADEGRLAMIDVSSGADDDGLHWEYCSELLLVRGDSL